MYIKNSLNVLISIYFQSSVDDTKRLAQKINRLFAMCKPWIS